MKSKIDSLVERLRRFASRTARRTFIRSPSLIVVALGSLLAAQEPTFKNSNKTVAVYATVSEAGGHLVPDLTESDFHINDDGKPQQVTVSSGDKVVATFAADNSNLVLRRIPITAAQLGTNEMAELKIEVDKTFVPAKLPGGRDPREHPAGCRYPAAGGDLAQVGRRRGPGGRDRAVARFAAFAGRGRGVRG